MCCIPIEDAPPIRLDLVWRMDCTNPAAMFFIQTARERREYFAALGGTV